MFKKYIFGFLILCCMISCNQSKAIQIKVGIVYKMGPQPVARTKFYLLNKQLETKYFTPPKTAEIFRETGAASKVEVGIDEDMIKDRIVATTVTDFDGNAVFDNVPTGTYWIAGFTRTRSEYGYVVWDYQIDTKDVKGTVILDQNNALESSDD